KRLPGLFQARGLAADQTPRRARRGRGGHRLDAMVGDLRRYAGRDRPGCRRDRPEGCPRSSIRAGPAAATRRRGARPARRPPGEELRAGERAEPVSDRIPFRIRPMLATLVEEPFHRPGWVYEEKYDGDRILAYKEGDAVRLLSRNANDHTARFLKIAAAVGALRSRTLLLDGEMVVFDRRGV